MKYNILIKKNNPEYIINLNTAIVTNLSEKKFLEIQKLNPDLLKDYKFISYKNVDFSWWNRINKFLTSKKLMYNQYFEIDYKGNVTRY